MPDSTSGYISDKYITLGQLTNRFSHDVSQLIRKKQTPLILELRNQGVPMTQVAKLLGISRQEVYEIIKEQDAKK